MRALEQRLGTQLLDRSGRRVEPTEAGLRLYRGAQRMLALEEQLLEELAEPDAPIRGTLELGASTGPGGVVLPLLLCEFQRDNPELRVELSVSDTQSVVELSPTAGSSSASSAPPGATARSRSSRSSATR